MTMISSYYILIYNLCKFIQYIRIMISEVSFHSQYILYHTVQSSIIFSSTV